MDASARGRGGGAEVHASERSSVRHELPHRTEEELTQVHDAAVEVAADEVAIVHLELDGPHGVTREDPLAEAGSEALDLRLDPLRHVDGGAVRDVAVRPGRVLSKRRARG